MSRWCHKSETLGGYLQSPRPVENEESTILLLRKGFGKTIKMPLSSERNGKSHHADAMTVQSPAD